MADLFDLETGEFNYLKLGTAAKLRSGLQLSLYNHVTGTGWKSHTRVVFKVPLCKINATVPEDSFMKNMKLKKSAAVLSTSALAAGMAHGAVVYTYTNLTVSGTTVATFDLNQDGTADCGFGFYDAAVGTAKPYVYQTPNKSVNSAGSETYVLSDATDPSSQSQGLPLTPVGTLINGSYESQQSMGFFKEDESADLVGGWTGSGNNVGYVGLELIDSSANTYYGWAQFIYNSTASTLTLVDYAMETQPNVGILTGQTAEPGSPPAVFIAPTPTNQVDSLGGIAQFTVIATGNPTPNYQWISGPTGSGIYTNLSDGGSVLGSASNILTISNLTLANQASYNVVLSNANGVVTNSAPVNLRVVPLLISGLTPSPVEVFAGGSVNLSLTVSGVGAIKYQWYAGSLSGKIAGATNASFTTNGITTNVNGVSFFCVASNSSSSVTSSNVAVEVMVPTPYEASIVAYHPVAYWPLNELSGTTAIDYAGNNDGTYKGNCTLGQTGLPATAGIGANTSVGFDGTTAYVDIPVGNLNITNKMTMIEWIQTSGVGTSFTTSMGHSDNSYRFDVAGPSGVPHFADDGGDVISTNPVTDGNWHQLVGVYDGTNQYLYVDGILAAPPKTSTPVGSADDVFIGGDPQYSPAARLFPGNIAQVAILTNALTAAQVQGVYYSLDLPPTVSISPASPSIYAGTSLTLTAITNGTPPLGFQWYSIDTLNDSNNIAGATNSTYTIANASYSLNGYTFGVVVSNSYGTNTASTPLTVNNVAAFIVQGGDLAPLYGEAYVGAPVIYTVSVAGSQPFSFTWLVDGTAVSGATNAVFTAPAQCGVHTIQAVITNSLSDGSPAISALATLQGDAYPTNLTFNTTGTGWQMNTLGVGNVPTISGNVLELTDGSGLEASSVFYDVAQYVGGFTASFTYTASGGSSPRADGMAFILQNSPANTNALGGNGGSLGYFANPNNVPNAVTNSVALEINLYSGYAVGIAPGTNGATYNNGGVLYAATGPVNVNSGDPINFVLNYANGNLSVHMKDATTSATFSTNYSFYTLTSILGGTDLAYVGFSGGDGSYTSVQTVSNFEFNSVIAPVTLKASPVSAGSIILSWSGADPSYVLQETTSLTSQVWAAGPAAVLVNGVYQASVPVTSGTNMFFRLTRVVCQ